jgi:hypothetical protein
VSALQVVQQLSPGGIHLRRIIAPRGGSDKHWSFCHFFERKEDLSGSQEARLDEERSDELKTDLQAAKIARTRTSVKNAHSP